MLYQLSYSRLRGDCSRKVRRLPASPLVGERQPMVREGRRSRSRRPSRILGPSGRSRRSLVHLDEAQIVARDLLGSGLAVEALRVGGVRLHRLAEDRAADREADVAVETRACAQPLVDLVVRGAAAEHDARDAVAAFAAHELRDLVARLAVLDPLDLPDVRLDAAVLQLQDRLHHQLRTNLGVVAILAAGDGLELRGLRGNEQLEEVLAVMLVQPLREAAQLLHLALVHRLIALRVVPDEHLREVRVVLLDLLAECIAVLEVELVLTRLLDRHRELVAARLRLARDAGAVLAVDEDAGELLRRAELDRALEAFPDQCLRARDVLLVPHHLLERPAMVEREDVETVVVPQFVQSDAHQYSLPVNSVSLLKVWRASIRRVVPERERITIESVIAPFLTYRTPRRSAPVVTPVAATKTLSLRTRSSVVSTRSRSYPESMRAWRSSSLRGQSFA